MLTLLNSQNLISAHKFLGRLFYVLRFEIQARNDKHYATNEEQKISRIITKQSPVFFCF